MELIMENSGGERGYARAPVWFDEAQLQEHDFKQEHYITELSRYVPLETISTHLDSYLSQLKLELVEVINAKYNDFVGLAGQLSGSEGAIIRMAKPLMELKKRLDVVERGIESELHLLSSNLEHRQKIKSARRSLETMQNAVHISSKIEKLMQEITAAFKSEDVSHQSALLERIAREISRLDLLLKENQVSPIVRDRAKAELQELALVRMLVQQNTGVTQLVQGYLTSCLEAVLKLIPADHASALRLLNAFAVLGETGKAEARIRDTLLQPFLTGIAGTARDDAKLQPLIEKLMEGLDGVYEGFFPVVFEASAGLQHYDFMGSCILAAFHDQMSHSIPFVFSPGKPDLFLENFKASLTLIDQLELRCTTVSALEQFRNGQAMMKFKKAWNLHVYFAMRFQEIAGMLDGSLEAEQIPLRALEDGCFYRVVSIWMQCLKQCFNPQIVTRELLDQFLKLFFRLLSRFEVWLKMHLDSFENKAEIESEERRSGFPQKNEDLALLEHDLSHAHSVLESEFYLQELDGSCQEAVEAQVHAFLARFQLQSRRLVSIIGERLLQECTVLVKKCVGTAFSTMFRPSGDRPTLPNDYVKRLMDPLRFFLESAAVQAHVGESVKTEIKGYVANGLCKAYHQALVETLSSREKSQISLRRFKGRLAGASASEGTPETSKSDELGNIYHQHWLDVCALNEVLKEFSISDLDAYRELRDLIISKKEAHGNSSP